MSIMCVYGILLTFLTCSLPILEVFGVLLSKLCKVHHSCTVFIVIPTVVTQIIEFDRSLVTT